MLAGAAVATGATVADSILQNVMASHHKVTVPTGPITEEVQRISKQARGTFELLELQLNDLYEILQREDGTQLKVIERNMDGLMKNVKQVRKNTDIPHFDQIKPLMEARQKLLQGIENVIRELQSGDHPTAETTSTLKALNSMKDIIMVGAAGLEIYSQIRKDRMKIMEVNEIIRKLHEQLQVLRRHELNIYSIMIPQLKIVEQTIKLAIADAQGKMHVELDVSRWSIQSALIDVKNSFNQMSRGFLANSELERSIDKINEGITTIIDVYDRINSYTEKAQLATLIADIAIGRNDVKDRELKEEVFKMDTIINANLLIEQYEMAMLALKQHKFPFAERFLDEFELPTNVSITDSELTSKTVNRISELVLKIQESKSLIEDADAFLYSNYSFVNAESFYNWEYTDHKNEIVNLCNGEEVILVADIDDGLQMSAVKFNEIWIKFKLKNESEHKQFYEELNEFSVMLQMVGNSYYRCDKRFYYISLEKSVPISFTLENGQPTRPNEIYSKLKTGDYFLSPYTTWKLSLIPKNNNNNEFRRLRPFANKVSELLLEGHGQYLENKKDFICKICNEELDKYYRLDSVENTHHL